MWISVGRVGAAAETVEQTFIPLEANYRGDADKVPALISELRGMDLGQKEKVLVFVGMKRTASWLANELGRRYCSELSHRVSIK